MHARIQQRASAPGANGNPRLLLLVKSRRTADLDLRRPQLPPPCPIPLGAEPLSHLTAGAGGGKASSGAMPSGYFVVRLHAGLPGPAAQSGGRLRLHPDLGRDHTRLRRNIRVAFRRRRSAVDSTALPLLLQGEVTREARTRAHGQSTGRPRCEGFKSLTPTGSRCAGIGYFLLTRG